LPTYADSNFITRLYLNRPESQTAEALVQTFSRDAAPPLPVSWLIKAETINAFQQSVFVSRTHGGPRVTPEQAMLAHAEFATDLATGSLFETTALPISDLLLAFEELALRHTASHGFRTYDLLHVASARILECDTFWTFDARATKLAKLAGLKTI
jgi:predicted nucleic acid-binding protein